jgi:hypothetical protein
MPWKPPEFAQRRRDADRRAFAHLQHGWFRRSASSGWITCPDCRAHITSAWSPSATPREIQNALRAALTEHLLEDHLAEGVPS